jgi:hypothetical protein
MRKGEQRQMYTKEEENERDRVGKIMDKYG